MITGEHYHVATGHESKNRGRLYRCQTTGKNGFGCCIIPAYDKEGKELTP